MNEDDPWNNLVTGYVNLQQVSWRKIFIYNYVYKKIFVWCLVFSKNELVYIIVYL